MGFYMRSGLLQVLMSIVFASFGLWNWAALNLALAFYFAILEGRR